MALSFAELKKNSNDSFKELQTKLEEADKKKSFEKDERFWIPTKDDAGNTTVVIRFLPAPQNESLPYVSYYEHSFDVNGRYYIERSLQSIGEEDQIGIDNYEYWKSGDEEKKKIASVRNRKIRYVANILVIKDTGNPENNGKVFLWTFGKKIFDKIKAKMAPDDEDTKPLKVFDLFEGANFKLKIKKVAGYVNYDDSEFLERGPLFDSDEEKMEKVWLSEHSLEAEVARNKFKTREELDKHYHWVITGEKTGKAKSAEEKLKDKFSQKSDEDDIDFNIKDVKSEEKSSPKKEESKSENENDDDFDLNLDDFNLDDDTPF